RNLPRSPSLRRSLTSVSYAMAASSIVGPFDVLPETIVDNLKPARHCRDNFAWIVIDRDTYPEIAIRWAVEQHETHWLTSSLDQLFLDGRKKRKQRIFQRGILRRNKPFLGHDMHP